MFLGLLACVVSAGEFSLRVENRVSVMQLAVGALYAEHGWVVNIEVPRVADEQLVDVSTRRSRRRKGPRLVPLHSGPLEVAYADEDLVGALDTILGAYHELGGPFRFELDRSAEPVALVGRVREGDAWLTNVPTRIEVELPTGLRPARRAFDELEAAFRARLDERVVVKFFDQPVATHPNWRGDPPPPDLELLPPTGRVRVEEVLRDYQRQLAAQGFAVRLESMWVHGENYWRIYVLGPHSVSAANRVTRLR